MDYPVNTFYFTYKFELILETLTYILFILCLFNIKIITNTNENQLKFNKLKIR